jgi:four helix bundle protein
MAFGFEDLVVWRRAIQFASDIIDVTEHLQSQTKHFRLIEQIESAATSVASNIAEGKGRHSKKEFVQFLYIARGSLYETVSLVTLFEQRRWISAGDFHRLCSEANEIAKMINGLSQSVKHVAV